MNMPLVCTSKNIWAELSYEFGPSCLINLGRVGMGRVLCGPSWHGPSWFWAELSVIQCFDLSIAFLMGLFRSTCGFCSILFKDV